CREAAYRPPTRVGPPEASNFVLDSLPVEAFALVREAASRVLSMRPYDVQVIAAAAIHQGKLAQMQTGEGKTLAAVLPVFLNALQGKGVHVLTANDYLAQRDSEWMGPVYDFFGLTADYIREGMPPTRRRKAYRADITYLTAKEAGFDFLRDQLCFNPEELTHRPFHYAIVDEADFIMIDEARVPLVIAGDAPNPGTHPALMAGIVRTLKPGEDYETDENLRSIHLTEKGLDRAEVRLGRGDLHNPGNLLLYSSLNVALHAEVLLHRDIDYIVRDGKIELVDEFTGRVADKRRWPHGIQTAVEAKEGVEQQPEGLIYGSITLQHFLKLYPKLAGMTATAAPAAEEFKTFYGLDVVVIPPNKPCIRVDEPDIIFNRKAAKQRALVEEITRVHRTGRPILVGTASVAESEELARSLQEDRVPCRVLNAKNNDVEAKIIAGAGAYKAVTISTNMAGRGTDICLGGEKEEERQRVKALGGLYVIGTNRHESRRIDNQLRGRSGRQGDPGSSRFFISLEDDLMERYNLRELLPVTYFTRGSEAPVTDPVVGREIARAQRIIEGQNFDIRRTLHNYALTIELQRRLVQRRRRDVLSGNGGLSLLEEEAGERYEKLCAGFGRKLVNAVERQITLYHTDRGWSEYLAQAADIREGIHLQRFGGKSPWVEYQKDMDQAFFAMQEQVEEKIVQTFKRVKVTKAGIDADKEGLRGPSSTWTYLINDNPFSNLGLDLIAGRNIGFSAGAGILAAYYLPVTLFLVLSRSLKKLFKRGAPPTS
ncbi:MAG: accessory Sec system translocase SecA2, partial [Candidatus Aminicenantes bacterium]|nr:accessory Sec system translocase SecA2 [Candidatus Aminicenantes bacterium]